MSSLALGHHTRRTRGVPRRSWWSLRTRCAVRATGGILLPLDLQGTAFQIRVWESPRAIPTGETRTYSPRRAQQIGSPAAVLSVRSACAANAAALAIPCHRVIRRDGSLGGYRGGLDAPDKHCCSPSDLETNYRNPYRSETYLRDSKDRARARPNHCFDPAVAEEVGFEPTEGFPSHDFQSCRFGRSRTPPVAFIAK